MVGSAALRHCQENRQLEPIVATRQELNLLDQKATFDFLQSAKPDVVLIAAAKVGGIHANSPIQLNLFTRIWRRRRI